MSILIEAIELFIYEGKNATNIYEYINDKYNLSTTGQKNIYRLCNIICKCISQYYQEVYKLEKLVEDHGGKNICVDESLFVHDSYGQQISVFCLIEVNSKNIRLELVKDRSNY